ncbi:hypothetical protein Q4595_31170, partial [Wenyingzhuangia sp. 1_MG-2023]|nr:hypothetical protein [Wenyingzhuangia sp. 1_MG-2023]
AMDQLVITYAESRRLHGQENFSTPSRFIREIPTELMDEVRLKNTVSRPLSARRSRTGNHRLQADISADWPFGLSSR